MFGLKEARHANHALFVRMFVHILPRVLFVTETRCGVVSGVGEGLGEGRTGFCWLTGSGQSFEDQCSVFLREMRFFVVHNAVYR
jgi:hypothetical protein